MQKLWEYKKLGDVCTVERGGSPRPIDKFITNDENGINWIKIGDTSDSMYITSTAQKIKKEGMKKSRYVKPGDFLLSNSMSFGRPYILKIDGCIHDGWLVLRDEKKVFDKRFLYYYLSSKSTYKKFEAMAVGGVVNNLNSEMVRNTYVPIPNKDVQLKIANQFDMVRSILESRKKESLLLENLVRARFVEIFGDPIINEKDWDVIKLNNACDGIGDGLHGTPKYDEYGVYPFINGNNLKAGVIEVTPITKMVNKETYKKHCSTMNYNTILLSINGTLGKLALYNGEEVMLGKSVCYCNLKSEVNREFVYGVMNTDAFKIFLESNATASTIKNVGLKAIRGFKLILPPKELQIKYVDFVKQVNKSKVEVQKALDKAQLLFDSLMQKYFG
jgi:restriction modification system DNA specificity domain protein